MENFCFSKYLFMKPGGKQSLSQNFVTASKQSKSHFPISQPSKIQVQNYQYLIWTFWTLDCCTDFVVSAIIWIKAFQSVTYADIIYKRIAINYCSKCYSANYPVIQLSVFHWGRSLLLFRFSQRCYENRNNNNDLPQWNNGIVYHRIICTEVDLTSKNYYYYL